MLPRSGLYRAGDIEFEANEGCEGAASGRGGDECRGGNRHAQRFFGEDFGGAVRAASATGAATRARTEFFECRRTLAHRVPYRLLGHALANTNVHQTPVRNRRWTIGLQMRMIVNTQHPKNAARKQ